jgi:hypothetical protein
MNAKQIVEKANNFHSRRKGSLMQLQVINSIDKITYRCKRFVTCPNWYGMEPVSWLS